MAVYEQRLAEDLDALRTAMEDITADVVNGLRRSVQGIVENNRDVLYEVVLDDLRVNRKIRKLDAASHAFVARHLPAAGHLRFVSSVLRLTVALERAGDYAVTISRVVLQLNRKLGDRILDTIAELAELSGSMLQDAVNAFLAGDAELARDTRVRGITIDRLYDECFHRLVGEEPRRPAFELASLLTIIGKIERVSDQAKNICEETVFAVTGELKAPKVFRILFLDERNDLMSPLAAAMGRKSHPDSAVFSSAGWAPAERVDSRLLAIADRFGLDAARTRPTRVKKELPDYPIDYHVIVALNADKPDEQIPRIPYHTVLRHWSLEVPSGDDASVDTAIHELSVQLRMMMERLVGPE